MNLKFLSETRIPINYNSQTLIHSKKERKKEKKNNISNFEPMVQSQCKMTNIW